MKKVFSNVGNVIANPIMWVVVVIMWIVFMVGAKIVKALRKALVNHNVLIVAENTITNTAIVAVHVIWYKGGMNNELFHLRR